MREGRAGRLARGRAKNGSDSEVGSPGQRRRGHAAGQRQVAGSTVGGARWAAVRRRANPAAGDGSFKQRKTGVSPPNSRGRTRGRGQKTKRNFFFALRGAPVRAARASSRPTRCRCRVCDLAGGLGVEFLFEAPATAALAASREKRKNVGLLPSAQKKKSMHADGGRGPAVALLDRAATGGRGEREKEGD